MKTIRCRITYANVMATIAVFIALGGASYAAVKLPPNSVGTRQIKNKGVQTSDIAINAIRTGRLAAAAVKSDQLGPIVVRTSSVIPVANGESRSAYAKCHAGEVPISGGARVSSDKIFFAKFLKYADGWYLTAFNDSGAAGTLQAEVYCLAQ